ncbi:MAG: CYTH domain-containing protein, partial [Amphiplicatus sp.]
MTPPKARSKEELEIKLQGAAGDIAALRRSHVFASLLAESPSWERLVSTYYDSPDAALSKAGASLRLREEAGGLVQTVKQRRRNGALCRLEEERAVGSASVFPLPPEDDALAALIAGAAPLAPVARTVTDRWAAVLQQHRTRIEAALDLGRAEILKDGRPALTAPLAEAELELLEGEPETLFRVARLCLEEADGRLRLGAATKEDQARRLVDGAPALAPEKNLALDAEAAVGDAFAAALTAAAVRVIELAPAVTDLRLPEGVHQMRVALRRLRAV